jgi:hypothetical protein
VVSRAIAEPSEEDAVTIVEFVFALTSDTTDEEAVWTSERVARLPEESPAPVRVLVPFAHTSAASVPKVVRERAEYAQTSPGSEARDESAEASDEVIDESETPSEVDAV